MENQDPHCFLKFQLFDCKTTIDFNLSGQNSFCYSKQGNSCLESEVIGNQRTKAQLKERVMHQKRPELYLSKDKLKVVYFTQYLEN